MLNIAENSLDFRISFEARSGKTDKVEKFHFRYSQFYLNPLTFFKATVKKVLMLSI